MFSAGRFVSGAEVRRAPPSGGAGLRADADAETLCGREERSKLSNHSVSSPRCLQRAHAVCLAQFPGRRSAASPPLSSSPFDGQKDTFPYRIVFQWHFSKKKCICRTSVILSLPTTRPSSEGLLHRENDLSRLWSCLISPLPSTARSFAEASCRVLLDVWFKKKKSILH